MTDAWFRKIAYPRNKEYTQRLHVSVPASIWDAAYSLKAESFTRGIRITFDEIVTAAIRDFLVREGGPLSRT